MFSDASEALAYILTLLTLANLNKFIGEATMERTAIHYRMVGHDGQPGALPLSDEWAKLAAQYDMLAMMTTAGYAELLRREDEDRAREHDEAFGGPELRAAEDYERSIAADV